MKKSLHFLIMTLLFSISFGLLTAAADSQAASSSVNAPVKKAETITLTAEQKAERDRLMDEVGLWEMQKLTGEVIPYWGYESACGISGADPEWAGKSEEEIWEHLRNYNKSKDPNWTQICDEQIERLYLELEKYGVRRLTQEEAEEEFEF